MLDLEESSSGSEGPVIKSEGGGGFYEGGDSSQTPSKSSTSPVPPIPNFNKAQKGSPDQTKYEGG